MGEDAQKFVKWTDFYRVWKFHGFNHDMNDAHGFAPHAILIALSQLRDEIDYWGNTILDNNSVISPGMLSLALLEHEIPAHMIIAHVSTSFGSPLYVSTRGERVKLDGEKEEKPFVAAGRETPGIEYTFRMQGRGLLGEIEELFGRGGAKVVAFPDTVPSEDIAQYFREEFEKVSAEKDQATDTVGKRTDITNEHDNFYWGSIQPDPFGNSIVPIRRGGGISQLELLAKLPRVLSMFREHLEHDSPSYLAPQEPEEGHFAYAGLEKDMGLVEDTDERARELANQRLYIYQRQAATFNPRVKCPVNERFDLTTNLTKVGRMKHAFVSQMVLPAGCAYVDKSTFLMTQALPGKVAQFLYERKMDMRSMKPFD